MRMLLTALALVVAIIAHADEDNDVLYQVSTIDALLSGVYDSVATVGSVTEHGDFGLGTFTALDGELILLDRIVYRAAVDGTVDVMPASTGTPFMAVTRFEPDQVLGVPTAQDYAAFQRWLEDKLPSHNIFYAVQVEGVFSGITYRSVPSQEKPYAPLGEVIAREQAVFEQKDIDGTLIGFWCPDFSEGVNVPGFHLHFLSADRRHGGHVLDFNVIQATVGIDETNGWDIKLPMVADYLDADLSSDRSAELHAVEQGKGAAAAESDRGDHGAVMDGECPGHPKRQIRMD